MRQLKLAFFVLLAFLGTVAHAERYNVRGPNGQFIKQQPAQAQRYNVRNEKGQFAKLATVAESKVADSKVEPTKAARYNVRDPQTGRFVKQAAPAKVERYSVRDPQTGRFIKISEVETKPEPMNEAHHAVELAPAKQKGTLGSWLRNNFTVRSSLRDQLSAAKSLRKAGQVEEARAVLGEAPAPRGLFERIALGRAERKLGSAPSSKEDSVETTVAPKRSTADASKALKSARRAVGGYQLDQARASIEHAESLGASKADLDRAYADLARRAQKMAKAYASHGMFDEALSSLQHAHDVPGSSAREEESQALLTKAAAIRSKALVGRVNSYYKAGYRADAARTLLEIHHMSEATGFQLSGGKQRDAARLAKALEPELHEIAVAQAEEEAKQMAELEKAQGARAAAESPASHD